MPTTQPVVTQVSPVPVETPPQQIDWMLDLQKKLGNEYSLRGPFLYFQDLKRENKETIVLVSLWERSVTFSEGPDIDVPGQSARECVHFVNWYDFFVNPDGTLSGKDNFSDKIYIFNEISGFWEERR